MIGGFEVDGILSRIDLKTKVFLGGGEISFK